jgi:AraC-like DNA-binding protein
MNQIVHREFSNSLVAQDTFLRPIEFTTAGLPAQDQFEAFRAAHETIVDICPVDGASESFVASQKIWPLDKLVLTSTLLPQKGNPIRWRHWNRAVLDHWYIVLPCSFIVGRALHRQPAASPTIHSLARPLEAQADGDGVLTLFVPRDLFPGAELDALLDLPLERGSGSLLADYLLALNRRLPRLAQSELASVVEATRCLIAACASPSRDRLAAARAPIELTLLERGRRLIRRRLAEPELSPEMICKELGVSRSRLYRLFEPIGGISHYVRRQRLLQARHALLDPSDTRSIVRIAEQWGFVDASTFSRAFRHEFGFSPKAAREAGRTGNGYPNGREGLRPPPEMQSLAGLLRNLSA